MGSFCVIDDYYYNINIFTSMMCVCVFFGFKDFVRNVGASFGAANRDICVSFQGLTSTVLNFVKKSAPLIYLEQSATNVSFQKSQVFAWKPHCVWRSRHIQTQRHTFLSPLKGNPCSLHSVDPYTLKVFSGRS